MARRQQERTEISRTQILEAALELFSRQGFRGTTVREIAEAAGRSTGNVYHHFPDKDTIFRTLLDQYWEAIDSPEHPVNRALADGTFPDNLEALGRAARQAIQQYRSYVALIYVDVVEFEGAHIRRFYRGMAERFRRFVETHPQPFQAATNLREEIPPEFAVMLSTRIFLQYFAVEILFGVPDHFGGESDRVVQEIATILRRGMVRDPQDVPSP
jgi:AcrR family transcriptional regulator